MFYVHENVSAPSSNGRAQRCSSSSSIRLLSSSLPLSLARSLPPFSQRTLNVLCPSVMCSSFSFFLSSVHTVFFFAVSALVRVDKSDNLLFFSFFFFFFSSLDSGARRLHDYVKRFVVGLRCSTKNSFSRPLSCRSSRSCPNNEDLFFLLSTVCLLQFQRSLMLFLSTDIYFELCVESIVERESSNSYRLFSFLCTLETIERLDYDRSSRPPP